MMHQLADTKVAKIQNVYMASRLQVNLEKIDH